jgi:hypothetical protein
VTAATGSPVVQQARDYLAAVEQELADLPAEDRSALLEDLALHLEALGAEDDDRPLAVRLGTPADYAADLRAAAGLPARPGGPASAPLRLRDRLARVPVAPAVREVHRLLGELRPTWWVLRGYLVVLVPCLVERDGISDVPVPAPLDSHVLGGVLVVATVVASVALGRRILPRPVGALVGAGGVLLVLASFVIGEGAWSTVTSPAPVGQVPEAAVGDYPLLSRYGPVTDVFPYAADGTPLDNVLLFDQDGRPLHVGFQEWWADGCVRVLEQPRAVDLVAVPNSFPQAYELPEQGLDAFGNPMTPGICVENLPRPDVPLPSFPAQSAAPAPGD